MTTNGEIGKPKPKRGAAGLVEPPTDGLVNYEKMRLYLVDERPAGNSACDIEVLNRTYPGYNPHRTAIDVVVAGYIHRCNERHEMPDERVIREMRDAS